MLPSLNISRFPRHLRRPLVSSWTPVSIPKRANAIFLGFTATATAAGGLRRRKTKDVTVNVKDLPQGMVPPEPFPDQDELSEGYPTVIQQARNNMRKFRHCVVLTRVGSFYELYCEQAEQYGALLGLKVASKKTNNGPVPMAGFPFFQLDRFLKALVQDHGKHVAISEETPNDAAQKVKSGGLLFNRQVLRVVTPGTLIDEQFLNPYEHNYLLAIYSCESTDRWSPSPSYSNPQEVSPEVGLSWLDVSSGDFFTQSIDLDSLASAVARISPREIVLHQNLQYLKNNKLLLLLKEGAHLITYYEPQQQAMSCTDWGQMLENDAASEVLDALSSLEVKAADLLLQYVKKQIPGLRFRLQSPIRHRTSDFMNIDKNSLRGLEVLRTLRDGSYKGSLLQAVKRTSTESGSRLLARRLTSPSMSHSLINERLDLVHTFASEQTLLEEIVVLLRKSFDTLRLLQKFAFGRGDADDLLRLARTIAVTQKIANVLERHSRGKTPTLLRLAQRFSWDGPSRVMKLIVQSIDEEGVSLRQRSQDSEAAEAVGMARDVLEFEDPETEDMSVLQKRLNSKRVSKVLENAEERTVYEDIWIMRRQASTTLDGLHEDFANLQKEKAELAITLRQRLLAKSLSLKFTPGLGHICHVKGKDASISLSVLENARTVGSSKSTRSFYYPEWTRLGARIEDAKTRIKGEEQNIFTSLRDEVIQNLVPLRRNATVLDELDVSCSFARLALEHNLVRPLINHSCEHKIIGGRHIMVDACLAETGRQFTSNDCLLNDKERIWLITGPNMAGKSTFLRQTALISILAQTGSFVPADYAEIGLVDHIFSRIGSADNLSQDQSTFMVEMLETAHILNHATRRSFVIMDEVGRGTTPEDGIAVGYAVLNHLRLVSGCRTLFATHFHALVDMTGSSQGMACYCTDLKEEEDGSFRFDHRLKRGVNRNSHALKVAKLAGLPEAVVKVAGNILKTLKDGKRIPEV